MTTASPRQLHVRTPCAALRPWVQRLFVVTYAEAHRDAHLPDTGFVLAVPFGGECRLEDGSLVERASFTGLCDHVRRHAHGRGNAVALASFTPLGAAALLRAPLDELANKSVDAQALLPAAEVRELSAQIADAPDDAQRLARLEAFLLRRIANRQADPLVAAAVAWLERAGPDARIEELVRRIGLSQSALERRFRRQVGVAPKRFASLVRLQAVQRLRAAGHSLTAIAHTAGYFDQAHFVHDFKRVAGMAPEAYFAATAAR